MALLRSIDMHLIEFVMSKDAAYDTMEIFGEYGIVDFIDLNKNEQSYELPFTKQIRRCNELIRKIKFMQDICKSHGVEQKSFNSLSEFKLARQHFEEKHKSSKYDIFDLIEHKIKLNEEFISETIQNIKNLLANRNQLIEYEELLTKCSTFVNEKEESFIQISRNSSKLDRNDISKNIRESNPDVVRSDSYHTTEDDTPFDIQEKIDKINVSSIAGTIKQEEVESLRKIVFRLSRGNVLVNVFQINKTFSEYMKSKSKINKNVFIITFEEGESLRNKLLRTAKSFSEIEFDIPESGYEQKIDEIKNKINETSQLILATSSEMKIYLHKICQFKDSNINIIGISKLSFYKLIAEYDRCIYIQLNKFCSIRALMHGYCWSPICAKEIICKLENNNLNISEIHLEDLHNHNIQPPTHFRTNKFIEPFQKIVDTYGVPAYKEINPTVFNIISFPFLFGVMFGDVGHGAILLLFAAYLCFFSAKLKKTSLRPMVDMRYLLLLCGVFSTFCGLIYNDFMSLPLEIFSSCYDINKLGDVSLKKDCVYPFGIDPAWALAKNELTYVNSLKMKFSIIIGVTQMSLGIFLKAINSIYFRRKLEFFFEFIPQLILFWCLFGYMILLIILKWLKPYSDTSKAPSIVGYMIDMFLKMGSISRDPLVISLSFNQSFQLALLLISVFCIPSMLLIKPLCNCRCSKNRVHSEEVEMKKIEVKKDLNKINSFKILDEEDRESSQREEINNEDKQKCTKKGDPNKLDQIGVDLCDSEEVKCDNLNVSIIESEVKENKLHYTEIIKEHLYDAVGTLAGEHHHSNGEMLVHQLIETIEFVLGTVSNTASYLRLWALSLAHSRLAHVFYDKTIDSFEQKRNTAGLFLAFPMFATATFGVLMCMDSMECFLHTLRLHWVEFQNKFYKGSGYRFNRFSIVNELCLTN